MSKKIFTIYIDGQAIPVSEQIYHTYRYYESKERYWVNDLKTEKISYNPEAEKITYIPSKEDSYERLIESDKQFISNDMTVEEQIDTSSRIDELLSKLTEMERCVIGGIFFMQKTEREISIELGISQNSVHYWKVKALAKLRNFLMKNPESLYQNRSLDGKYIGGFYHLRHP